MAAIKAIGSAAADLLIPICCVVCERLMVPGEQGIVCGHCWTRVRELPHPRCRRCGHPVDSYSCRWCAFLPPFVRAARSFCWIGPGTGKDIVHALKYDGWLRVADAMAERMARLAWPLDVTDERKAIVPVPLAASRLRERGFNQSQVIAERLSDRWGIPALAHCLQRSSSERSQTELTPAERLSNVAGAFSAPRHAVGSLRGAHVILLDDVITTGATLRACASALFASGARTVSYMTFGRAPASGDRLIT
ncbi:MAG: ComF family protein [Gemmatimonadales bacterium]